MTRFFLLLLGLIFQRQAHAYPDMIRHNYVNCNACHVSPTGGGLLTPYGRGLSKEVLSTWSTEREPEFLHGALPADVLPEWLLLGGDVRGIQTHRESPDQKTGKAFLMESTIDLGFVFKKWTAVLSVGEADPQTNNIREVGTHYYLMWTPLDELSVRAGRFIPVFGLNTPYHTMPTRQNLGFGPGTERDAVESVWSGEQWNIAGSVSRTPAGPTPSADRETLLTGQINRSFLGSYRVGVSYMNGKTQQVSREAYGIHGLLGISEKWAYLTEFDLQRLQPQGRESVRGLFHFSQLIYEITKGFSVYVLEDYSKSNLNSSDSLINSVGPGLRFFPRPHFDFDLIFLKRRTAVVADRYDDYAWLMAHYYF